MRSRICVFVRVTRAVGHHVFDKSAFSKLFVGRKNIGRTVADLGASLIEACVPRTLVILTKKKVLLRRTRTSLANNTPCTHLLTATNLSALPGSVTPIL